MSDDEIRVECRLRPILCVGDPYGTPSQKRMKGSPLYTGLTAEFPGIVPASSQNRASRANDSQNTRQRILLKRLDLTGKTKMAERRIDV
jgi:hypothetical protein